MPPSTKNYLKLRKALERTDNFGHLNKAEHRLKLAKSLWDYRPTEQQAQDFLSGSQRLRSIYAERGSGMTTLLAHDIATFAMTHPLHLQVIRGGGASLILMERVKALLMVAKENAVANRLFPFAKELWMTTYGVQFGENRDPSVTWDCRAYLGRTIERLIIDNAYGFKLSDSELSEIEVMYKSNRISHITVAGTRDFDQEAQNLSSQEENYNNKDSDWLPYIDDYASSHVSCTDICKNMGWDFQESAHTVNKEPNCSRRCFV